MRAPACSGSRMGEGGRLAGREQPVDRAARGAAAVRVELAEQVDQADPPAGFASPSPALRASAGLSSTRRASPAASARSARLASCRPRRGGAAGRRRPARHGAARTGWRGGAAARLNGLTRKWVAPSSMEAVERARHRCATAGRAGRRHWPRPASASARTAVLALRRARRARRRPPPPRRTRRSALSALSARRAAIGCQPAPLGQPRQLVAMAKGQDGQRR